MIKIIKITFFIFFLLYLTGCLNSNNHPSNPNDTNPETIRVKDIDLQGDIKAGDVYDQVQFIKLETTNKSLFGKIDRIILTKDNIFILDWLISKDIFVFNRSGKFITRFGQRGKGPGEFISPSDFYIDSINKTIVVLDNGEYLHSYKLINNTLEFVKTEKIPQEIGPFEVTKIDTNGNFAFICGRTNPNLCITDNKFRNIKYHFPYYNRNFSALLLYSLVYSDKYVLYQRYLNDTIFKLIDNLVIPHIVFDFEQPFTLKNLLKMDNTNQLENMDKMYKLGSYFELNNMFIFSYSHLGKVFYLFRNQNNQYMHTSKVDFINDIYGSGNLNCKGIDPLTKSFIFTASPINILNVLNSHPEKLNIKYKRMLNSMNLNDTDNTILVLLK